MKPRSHFHEMSWEHETHVDYKNIIIISSMIFIFISKIGKMYLFKLANLFILIDKFISWRRDHTFMRYRASMRRMWIKSTKSTSQPPFEIVLAQQYSVFFTFRFGSYRLYAFSMIKLYTSQIQTTLSNCAIWSNFGTERNGGKEKASFDKRYRKKVVVMLYALVCFSLIQ